MTAPPKDPTASVHPAAVPRKPLTLLMVEDSEDDALLLQRTLRREGYDLDVTRVETRAAFAQAMEDVERWDLVVSDYHLPTFDGLEALRLLRERDQDVPFLLVSGTIGEDVAVEAMRAGAHDYLIKGRLARLGAAVSRELREATIRRERRQGSEALTLLAEAGAVLSRTLDRKATIECALKLVVPRLCPSAWVTLGSGRTDGTQSLAVAERQENGSVVVTWPTQQPLQPQGMWPIEIPLVAADQRWGGLFLGMDRPRKWGPVDPDSLAELGRRIGQALANAELYLRAQQAAVAREEFLVVASHELRTPLTPLALELRLIGSLVARLPQDELRGKLEQELQRAHQPLRRLTRLVADLLDVTTLTAGGLALQPAPCDLVQLARAVLDEVRPGAEAAGVQLVFAAPDRLPGDWDADRLAHLLRHLISNAIKFGDSKPVEVTLEQPDAAWVQLSVRDRGRGLAPDQHARMFQPFERAVPVRHYGGFGLGLWLVRMIAEAHGGSVGVTSKPGAGATFVVRLPLGGTRNEP